MCGIFSIFLRPQNEFNSKMASTIGELAYNLSYRQRHRGPDYTGFAITDDKKVCFVQERLAILGVETGNQPLKSDDGSIMLTANGEIYNYLQIARDLSELQGSQYVPRSDCDVIIALYAHYGEKLFSKITGMFAFVLYDNKTKQLLVARDPFGIIPMYQGIDVQGNLYFASEMKCLVGVCETVTIFPPGKFLYGTVDDIKEEVFYSPKWITDIPTMKLDLEILREKLEDSVRSHLQCDVQLGALLSGGVDSSLIASIATKIMRERDPNYRLKTFSVGLQNAPDFKYSRMVAEYINSDHHEVIFEVEQGINCIREIIHHTESYDVTTIRASIPMLLLSRYIKARGLKMILSGEGADEMLGGYLYFFNAPNSKEFHKETVRRVLNLHYSDCLRANKSTLAWGLELRVPFLDTDFVNHVMSLSPECKMPGAKNQVASEKNGIEKYIIRAAFDGDYLPDEVLWRQKEQFSDGVGYSWIDTIKAHSTAAVSDEEFSRAAQIYPHNTPTTKEAFHYRSIFESLFPGESCAKTVMKWVPRLDWGCNEDPSGRAQTAHVAAYKTAMNGHHKIECPTKKG